MRFTALLPAQIMGDTQVGQAAASGYANAQGITSQQFLDRFDAPMTPHDVAEGGSAHSPRPPSCGDNAIHHNRRGAEGRCLGQTEGKDSTELKLGSMTSSADAERTGATPHGGDSKELQPGPGGFRQFGRPPAPRACIAIAPG